MWNVRKQIKQWFRQFPVGTNTEIWSIDVYSEGIKGRKMTGNFGQERRDLNNLVGMA